MEENQIQNDLEILDVQQDEPITIDNSQDEQSESVDSNLEQEEGQSLEPQKVKEDPSEDLILGKFKSVDDLTKAYLELQKCQGKNSQELGELRKENSKVNGLSSSISKALNLSKNISENLVSDQKKYDKPEYFQEQTFRNLYREAFLALNGELDTDRFIDLLESYVVKRLGFYEQNKLAQAETQKALNAMGYKDSTNTTFTPPQKSFDEMNSREIDELLERLI